MRNFIPMDLRQNMFINANDMPSNMGDSQIEYNSENLVPFPSKFITKCVRFLGL